VRIGGQEHFYLETQASLVVPGENDEFTVFASTQNPTKTSNFVANALGVGKHKVVCKAKRMGGGFGGKETRSVSYTRICIYT
jgi:xanthine dehydrogenase/oxidase